MSNKNKRGFTFLELLVSAGIIIVTFSGLISAYMRYNEMIETTKNSNLALGAIQEEMEKMRKVAVTSLSNYTFNVSAGHPLENASLGRVTVTGVDLNLTNTTFQRVDVDFCWKQSHGRIIGPCIDNNGTLVFDGDNVDANSTAPVQATTFMAQR